MICRAALHEKTPGSVTSDEARAFRQWIKEHPGFVGGYHVQDSKTGRMLSITIWDSEESMEALSAHASLLVTVVALYNSAGLRSPTPLGKGGSTMTEETRESSFDELARGMASGILSRGKALRWLGAAPLGGALAPSHRRWQRQRTSLIDAIAGPGVPLSVLVLHEATVPHVSEAGRRILTRLAGGASGKIHCVTTTGGRVQESWPFLLPLFTGVPRR